MVLKRMKNLHDRQKFYGSPKSKIFPSKFKGKLGFNFIVPIIVKQIFSFKCPKVSNISHLKPKITLIFKKPQSLLTPTSLLMILPLKKSVSFLSNIPKFTILGRRELLGKAMTGLSTAALRYFNRGIII